MTSIDEALAAMKAEAAKIEAETESRLTALCDGLAKDLRMAADGWIKHDPSKGEPFSSNVNPFSSNVEVEVILNDGTKKSAKPFQNWNWGNCVWPIAYYREVKDADAPEPEPEAGPWKPKEGDEYFYLSPGGFVSARFCYDHTLDQQIYAIGNCFPTREGAEHARDRRILAADHERAAEADRAKNARRTYHFYIMRYLGVWDAKKFEGLFPGFPMFHTEAAAQAFIDARRDDFERLHGEGV